MMAGLGLTGRQGQFHPISSKNYTSSAAALTESICAPRLNVTAMMALLALLALALLPVGAGARKPNFLVIFADGKRPRVHPRWQFCRCGSSALLRHARPHIIHAALAVTVYAQTLRLTSESSARPRRSLLTWIE